MKRPIESYDHRDKQRVNNPPVGLVTPDTDPDAGAKKTYPYDPHLGPEMRWDGKPDARVEEILAELAGLQQSNGETIQELQPALERGNLSTAAEICERLAQLGGCPTMPLFSLFDLVSSLIYDGQIA